ncbi:efflux transporter outer membrane subunit [Candidatus Nitrotoga sp. 1052]|uniref:efflux transporter outer membrane subunit n=1 Tax=Candidatus Nitrotoga sp. 1052 TaxID=2886964 RepID=UPI001EF42EB7|nr:efflux transporter outer membrane subunit [Candidatus Nitrotoga sp. 1052]
MLLMHGCSFVTPYQPPIVVPVKDAWRDSLWKEAQPSDELPRGSWWRLFGDKTLNELQEKMERNNPTLAIAVARFDQSTAYVRQLGAAQLPSLDADAGITRNRQSDHRPLRNPNQPGFYNSNTVSMLLNYELDLWGRIRNSIAAGQATAQASAADLESTRLSLHALLAEYYIRLRNVDAQSNLLGESIQVFEKNLTFVENRHSGGIASGLDVARAETQVNIVKVELSELKIQRAVYEHAIASVVGESATAFKIPPVSDLDLIKPPRIPVGLPSTLLQRRPDIASAERKAEAANARVGVAQAAFFPSISLSGSSIGFQNTGGSDWLTAPNLFWSIGPRVIFNIFDGNLRQSQVDQAKAVLDQAGQEYRAVVLQAFQQVEDELVRLKYLKQQIMEQNAAAISAHKAETLANYRYKNGAVTYLEVSTAQTVALQADRGLLALRAQSLVASVGLIRGLGGGWSKQA